MGDDGRYGCTRKSAARSSRIVELVIAKNAGEWQIVVMHNLDLTALRPSNSRNSATTKP